MNANTNQEHDEAQEILAALRQIQDNPELKAEAEKNPEAVLTRLGLSEVARHAVAFGITGIAVAGSLHLRPNGFWV